MKYSAPDEAEENFGPSKSALKREMIALQKLGVELVALSRDQLKKIDLPERLRDAILDAQRFTQHEAHRRQLQYIGKIMRDIDAAPLQAALDEINGISTAATLRLQRLERLRAQLMEDESVCSDIARDYPGADIQLLRQLRRNAIKEAQQNKPPRAYRELFRVLREMQKNAANEASPDDAADGLDDAGQSSPDGFSGD
ncbi:MAG: ribosome biogenesis factor YjgA [Rugosibacter sp.]|jgi:ribosome-associated protein|nr:ribosome-associated protein [Rugosibacter sp.]